MLYRARGKITPEFIYFGGATAVRAAEFTYDGECRLNSKTAGAIIKMHNTTENLLSSLRETMRCFPIFLQFFFTISRFVTF